MGYGDSDEPMDDDGSAVLLAGGNALIEIPKPTEHRMSCP